MPYDFGQFGAGFAQSFGDMFSKAMAMRQQKKQQEQDFMRNALFQTGMAEKQQQFQRDLAAQQAREELDRMIEADRLARERMYEQEAIEASGRMQQVAAALSLTPEQIAQYFVPHERYSDYGPDKVPYTEDDVRMLYSGFSPAFAEAEFSDYDRAMAQALASGRPWSPQVVQLGPGYDISEGELPPEVIIARQAAGYISPEAKATQAAETTKFALASIDNILTSEYYGMLPEEDRVRLDEQITAYWELIDQANPALGTAVDLEIKQKKEKALKDAYEAAGGDRVWGDQKTWEAGGKRKGVPYGTPFYSQENIITGAKDIARDIYGAHTRIAGALANTELYQTWKEHYINQMSWPDFVDKWQAGEITVTAQAPYPFTPTTRAEESEKPVKQPKEKPQVQLTKETLIETEEMGAITLFEIFSTIETDLSFEEWVKQYGHLVANSVVQ